MKSDGAMKQSLINIVMENIVDFRNRVSLP